MPLVTSVPSLPAASPLALTTIVQPHSPASFGPIEAIAPWAMSLRSAQGAWAHPNAPRLTRAPFSSGRIVIVTS